MMFSLVLNSSVMMSLPSDMDCYNPTTVKSDYGYISVPCGCCILCRIARTREWSTRLQLENSCWKDSVFVTLTYDDDHLPLTGCGRATLNKPDLQNFFKRLRSKFDEDARIETHLRYPDLSASDPEFKVHVKELTRKFKYFACGEYGDHTERSHYHAIIFGLSPSDICLFEEKWPYGFVSVGGVSPQSIQYVTGYVRKKRIKKCPSPDEVCSRRVSEFQIQSQGLGLNGYNSFREFYRKNMRIRIDGHDVSIPRYFLKKDPGLSMLLKLERSVSNPVSENLKRAQKILDARANDKDILVEQQLSAIQKAKTEIAKDALFRKGRL